jgi:hypothetical protein
MPCELVRVYIYVHAVVETYRDDDNARPLK